MGKFLLTLILLFVLVANIVSDEISEENAKIMAKNFFNFKKNYTSSQISSESTRYYNDNKSLYIFNLNSEGFVIVPSINDLPPILSYSLNDTIDFQNIAPSFNDILDYYDKGCDFIRTNMYQIDYNRNNCNDVLNNNLNNFLNTQKVDPLLETYWGQGSLYNEYCPADPNGPNGHVYVGCVAVAMGQIMKYWNYPQHGFGEKSYNVANHPEYGEQYANFGETYYDWDNMPTHLNYNNSQEEIDAVATLLYHCGVSVNMDYGPNGSGAYMSSSSDAFDYYFGYENQLICRCDYTDQVWIDTLKSNLDRSLPISYSAITEIDSSYIGHNFVVDGYDENQYDYFHLNLGWNGYSNGFYNLLDLYLDGYDFNIGHSCISNLHPKPIKAYFDVEQQTVDFGEPIIFRDFSLSYPENEPITNWQWDFDSDGNIDLEYTNYQEQIEYTYPHWGRFSVSLIVSTNTHSDTLIRNNYIKVRDNLTRIYLSPDGQDLPGYGTENQPYATINYAVYMADEGDTLIFLPGTYNYNIEDLTTIDKNLTFASKYILDGNYDNVTETVLKTVENTGPIPIFSFSPNSSLNNIVGLTFSGGSNPGSAIEFLDSSVNISHSIFNSYSSILGAINMAGLFSPSNLSLENVIFYDNTGSNSNETTSCINMNGNAYLNVNKSTFSQNVNISSDNSHTFVIGASGNSAHINIRNSIIYYNATDIFPNINRNDITITYSDIEGGFIGTGNIDVDPQICLDEGPYKYHLLETSPCIDAGDPDDTGGDVRIDMGAYETTTDVKPLKGNHWNWISFPRVQRPNNDPMIDAPADAPAILTNMLPFLNNLRMKSLYGNMLTYDINNGWHPDNFDIQSTKGYKLYLEDNSDFILPIQGIRLDSLYSVQLTAGENWIGYWLPGTATFDEALGAYKDRFTQIKAENWTMTKVNGTWIGPAGASFTYGKGYIMYVDTQNWHNGFEFKWNCPFASGGREFKKEKTKNFTYEEKADYEVIDIQYIENGEDIEEIGAFVNGICVGASKVKEYPVQILAYTEDANKAGDDNTFYFEVVTSDKSEPKKLNDILVYNLKTNRFEKSELHTTIKGYHLIKLTSKDYEPVPVYTTELFDNYPNPFNPETRIKFSLSKAQNIELNIYNIKGQLVKNLIKGHFEKGIQEIVWDGKNNKGKSVSSGLYFYSLKTKNKIFNKKMILLK